MKRGEASVQPRGRVNASNLLRRLEMNPARSLGLVILCFLLIVAVFASYIAPYNPRKMGWAPFLSPNPENLLGTDDMGKDIFSQLIYASRISLAVGFAAATVSIAIGVVVGLLAGYLRGLVEEALMGVTDLFLLIPGFPLMILVSSYLGPGIANVVLVIVIRWWCSTARVVHSRVLQVREMPFIESTKAMGFSRWYIMVRHVLLNAKDAIVAKWSLSIASAMLAEAGLAFLGLGDPYQISWGGMISNAFNRGGFAMDLWWWYLAPGAMICVSAAAFFLISMDERRESYRMEMV